MRPFWQRIGLAGGCVILAICAAMQAYANNHVRTDPVLAAAFSPFAAEPSERLATMSLQAVDEQVVFDTPMARILAEKAYRRAPLSGDAAAILAMSLDEEIVSREEVLAQASLISRRDKVLGLAILQDAASRRNEGKMLQTLNQLFLTSPSLTSRFLPLFVSYLENDALLPEFEAILASNPVWADRFFQTGGLPPKALDNLAKLRTTLPSDVELSADTDRLLIARLATSGQMRQALLLHERLGDREIVELDRNVSWVAENPPFDWSFTDDRGFYARPSSDGETLRFRVTPGKGGPLAKRLLRTPVGAGVLELTSSLGRGSDLENFAVNVRCALTGETIVEVDLVPGKTSVPLASDACTWIEVTLSGRVWSTSRQVDGAIRPLRFTS